MNNAFMKPMAEILHDYAPAYPYEEDGTREQLWEKGFQICREDSLVVKNLTIEYQRDGAFREPIILSDEGCILNGMHRLTVLKDLSIEEARVIIGYPDSTHDFLEISGITHLTTDEIFDIYDETMSIPFSDEFWLNFDFLSTKAEGRKTRLHISTFNPESVNYIPEITAWVKDKYSLQTITSRITNLEEENEDEAQLSVE